MLADNRTKDGAQRSLTAQGTLNCLLRGAILTRIRKQDDDRDGKLVRHGAATQDGVVGPGISVWLISSTR